MSALCALGNKKNLIDKVCVHRDEQVGVYGFVFHRGKTYHSLSFGTDVDSEARWGMDPDDY